MARPLRVEFPGAVYYLASEGNGGAVVFHEEADRALFLTTLGEAAVRMGWEVLAFRLAPARLELLIRTPSPNLVLGMKWLLGAFTIKYNRRHQRRGHLLAGRYRSVLVEPVAPYLPAAAHFIHLGAAEQEAPRLPDDGGEWCSFAHFLRAPAQRPPWLAVPFVLAALGEHDDDAGRAHYARLARAALATPPADAWAQLRRGWRMGSEDFRRGALERLRQTHGNSANPNRAFAREQADWLVREELATLGWTEDELRRRPKGDAEKIRIARRLRAETTASLRWIATRLHMGAWTSAANRLYRRAAPALAVRRALHRRKPAPPPAPVAEPPPPRAPVTPPDDLPVHCL